ncbi:hypothetical protein [Clostridium sp.]|uniref:hypothetical protein n=1 Tax=Clostridium sp. TaxID=1506 RepID=UPI002FC6BFE5
MSDKIITLNPNCPCTRKCPRHGNCKECRENHENKTTDTWCIRIEKKKSSKKS